ncbi:MAG: hypothetical protein M1828_003388 [Chrysothrix sp. TS-e1954]|nr:MAG: hypothetical protein M1828_003388 [Chrysothrix sp. TS-e1954]
MSSAEKQEKDREFKDEEHRSIEDEIEDHWRKLCATWEVHLRDRATELKAKGAEARTERKTKDAEARTEKEAKDAEARIERKTKGAEAVKRYIAKSAPPKREEDHVNRRENRDHTYDNDRYDRDIPTGYGTSVHESPYSTKRGTTARAPEKWQDDAQNSASHGNRTYRHDEYESQSESEYEIDQSPPYYTSVHASPSNTKSRKHHSSKGKISERDKGSKKLPRTLLTFDRIPRGPPLSSKSRTNSRSKATTTRFPYFP